MSAEWLMAAWMVLVYELRTFPPAWDHGAAPVPGQAPVTTPQFNLAAPATAPTTAPPSLRSTAHLGLLTNAN